MLSEIAAAVINCRNAVRLLYCRRTFGANNKSILNENAVSSSILACVVASKGERLHQFSFQNGKVEYIFMLNLLLLEKFRYTPVWR